MERERETYLGDFCLKKVIGKGSYGEVWLTKHVKDKRQYVLKKIALHNVSVKEKKSAQQECKLLAQLKHPNIVAYKDSFEHKGFIYIAMGYCEGGDLYNRLKQQNGTLLEERQVVEWFVQISMSLQYMHERNILHRDLKTQNIFLTRSKLIKVGDLGIARVLDSSSDMATTLIGTPYYMSPELYSNRPYNHKSDVWALGCCVYEMATLKHAFNAKDFNSLAYKILKGKVPDMPRAYSPELLELIRMMLNQNPDKRPSANRILRDNFIRKHIQIFLEGTKQKRRGSNSRPSTAASEASRAATPKDKDGSDGGRKAAKTAAPEATPQERPPVAPSAKRQPPPPLPPTEAPSRDAESGKLSHSSGESATPSESVPVQRCPARSSARERRRRRLETQEKSSPPPSKPAGGYHLGNGDYSPAGPVLVRRKPGQYAPGGGSGGSGPEHVRQLVLVQKDRHRRNQSEGSAGLCEARSESEGARPKLQRPLSSVEAAGRDAEEEKEKEKERKPKSPASSEEEKEKAPRASIGDEGEMSDLVDCMNATLNLKSGGRPAKDQRPSTERSAADSGSPERNSRRHSSSDFTEDGPTEKTEETIGRSNRMMERLTVLRKDCLRNIGLEKLKQAYDILENIECEDADTRLRALLGDHLFQEYSSKIWQLKFCEESLFGPARVDAAGD